MIDRVSQENTSRVRIRAGLALLLLVPAPTLGVWVGMWSPLAGSPLGEGLYFASKLWILLLPAIWYFGVERGRWNLSRPTRAGLVAGAASGIVLSGIIFAAYILFGGAVIDPDSVREAAQRYNLADPVRYLAFAAYLCTINALLEEYVWRWFCYRQCEALTGAWRGWAAVLLAAAFFTTHHVLALAAQLDLGATILASAGVFIGGVIWSYFYRRYRSIWPGFLSHAIVDVAILAVGWMIIMPS